MLTVIKTYDTNTVSVFDHDGREIAIHTNDIPALIKLLKDAHRPPKKASSSPSWRSFSKSLALWLISRPLKKKDRGESSNV